MEKFDLKKGETYLVYPPVGSELIEAVYDRPVQLTCSNPTDSYHALTIESGTDKEMTIYRKRSRIFKKPQA